METMDEKKKIPHLGATSVGLYHGSESFSTHSREPIGADLTLSLSTCETEPFGKWRSLLEFLSG